MGQAAGVMEAAADRVADAGRVFVLGAKDPEMHEIATVLRQLRFPVLGATRGGKRVYPGNAYRADPPRIAAGAGVTLYAVECRWPGETLGVVHIDHHHPGDPGYGKPPADYFAASSIGQVFALLRAWLPRAGRGDELARLTRERGPEIHRIAAADHCLGAAYRGECPGVGADELKAWMLERRAAFLRRPVTDVAAELEASQETIRRLAVDGLADLRGLPGGTLPEAPDAACRAGIAVLTQVVDRDRRHKVGLLGATPEQVRRFLSGALVPGLVDCYGDPARGFAGGYLPVPGDGSAGPA